MREINLESWLQHRYEDSLHESYQDYEQKRGLIPATKHDHVKKYYNALSSSTDCALI